MLREITFTSKASLKQQCLYIANANIKEAKELYDFLVEDMPDLPPTDPIPPSWQANARETVDGIMGWVKENQGTISQAIDFFRGLFGKKPILPVEPPTPLQPIN